MGEARRRKLAGTYPAWDDPKARATLLGLIHEALAQDHDPTVTGMTVLMPGYAPIFLSAAEARKSPPKRSS